MHRFHVASVSLAALLAIGSAAKAQYAPSLNLGALNGKTGSRFDGRVPNANAGHAVAAAGDVNGDRIPDFIVTAPLGGAAGRSAAGVSHVVFGRVGSFAPAEALWQLDGTNGFSILGPVAMGHSGWAVTGAGDINRDGYDDVLIGSASGRAHVVFGKRRGFPAKFDLAGLNGRNGFTLEGVASGDRTGNAVAGLGDINYDGAADIMVGAPLADPNGRADSGAAYVVFGRAGVFPKRVMLADLNGQTGFRVDGAGAGDRLGAAVAGGGDTNGDGQADLLLGAPNVSVEGVAGVGAAYIISGGEFIWPSSIDLSQPLFGSAFVLQGEGFGSRAGFDVDFAGDVDGDGYDDILLASPGLDTLATPEAGGAYLVYGSPSEPGTPFLSELVTSGKAKRFRGAEAGDLAGVSVAGAGDANGDGFDDIVVGAQGADPGGREGAGAAYLVFGKAGGIASSVDLASLDGVTGMRLEGAAPGDRAGSSVAGAGDPNGNGFSDILIGAPLAARNATAGVGRAYLVAGLAPTAAVNRDGSKASQTIRGGRFGDTLAGLGGDDELEGGADADTLDGGEDEDTASYEHAGGGVSASISDPAGNTGDAAGDKYLSIENLRGSRFGDRLTGDKFENRITGSRGKDILSGGATGDHFVYISPKDSRPGSRHRDVIADFDLGTGDDDGSADLIWLADIDANSRVMGHQRFKFIGTRRFSMNGGELRVTNRRGKVLVQADISGDGEPDFEIYIRNLKSARQLKAEHFVLDDTT